MEVRQLVRFESIKRKRLIVPPAINDEKANFDLGKKCDDKKDFGKLFIATRVAKLAVAYYNDEARNNEDGMELIRIKESYIQRVVPKKLFFVYFVARLTKKDENGPRKLTVKL